MRLTESATRRRAVERGLEFIYRTSCDPRNFNEYGFDYLSCFNCIASTSKDKALAKTARRMGRERARIWRDTNAVVPPDASAETISNLVFGSDAADRLGLPDKKFKDELRRVAGSFTALDYFRFDVCREPPPKDLPAKCG